MAKVAVVTDSSCDLDPNVCASMGVPVLPLGVDIDGQQYLDRVDISPAELYRRMLEDKVQPKTFQVSPGFFIETFGRLVNEGKQVVYVGFSSKLSGTYQSACMAAQEFPGQVIAVDSKAASVGQGLMVAAAAQLADSGAEANEIKDRIEWMSQRMEHLFCVDSLEYLRRGGRISHTKALVGTLLGIKPILHFVDGAIYPLENTRSRKKAMNRMLELMEQRGVDLTAQTIGLDYAGDTEPAMEMKARIEERFGCRDFLISEVGAAIGSHAGPGTFSVFFLGVKQGGAEH